tara:strand:+ start:52414 stop:53556 length:1143 start_codon:yes stop_codon:yes gene_type:complete
MGDTAATFDCIVVGAGIAGASVAAELAAHRRVLLVERETMPGRHSTGRSAALFTETYGPPVIRAMSRASASFFHTPDSPHVDHPLLRPRSVVFVARDDQMDVLSDQYVALQPHVELMTVREIEAEVPLLRRGHAAAGLRDITAADIDVNALHQHYLRSFRAAGGTLCLDAEVRAVQRKDGAWQIETKAGNFAAPVVINAAGAWADELAELAGVRPAGLTPKRRTVLIVAGPDGMNVDDWPMVVDVEEEFYLKPDAGKLLISPADQTPSAPCDAQPEELDIAICVDRIQNAFNLPMRRIENKWAGLRSFLPDGDPVVGYDPQAEGFFWLAGQGGYGIQTAPAMARTASALVMHQDIPEDIAAQGVTISALARERKGLPAQR